MRSDIQQAPLHLHLWSPDQPLQSVGEPGQDWGHGIFLNPKKSPFAEQDEPVILILGVHAHVDAGQHQHPAEDGWLDKV